MIIHGDCLEELKKLEDNTVDAVVCDPPYGLSFMGKKWDYDVPSVEIWQECLRVLKPGGYLLAFAGTRTQHRMAVRIEDAGFEIRDMIAWVYGSGFPKSLNIGKAVDKLQGNEREVIGEKPTLHHGTKDNIQKYGFATEGNIEITKGTSEWEGWGTALKPALEPITVARKPLSEKTVAENVLKWGTGGINIDGSRVVAQKGDKFGGGGLNSPVNGFMGSTDNTYQRGTGFRDDTALGRFPANLIHDGSDEVVDLFPNSKGFSGGGGPTRFANAMGGEKLNTYQCFNDSGSAARFFYCPKASKSERNRGCEGLEEKQGIRTNAPRENEDVKTPTRTNNHPTVKPIALMEYLVNLVSKEGAIILDPFAGSGSTGLACKNLGREFILIERDPEYVKIIEARLQDKL